MTHEQETALQRAGKKAEWLVRVAQKLEEKEKPDLARIAKHGAQVLEKEINEVVISQLTTNP